MEHRSAVSADRPPKFGYGRGRKAAARYRASSLTSSHPHSLLSRPQLLVILRQNPSSHSSYHPALTLTFHLLTTFSPSSSSPLATLTPIRSTQCQTR